MEWALLKVKPAVHTCRVLRRYEKVGETLGEMLNLGQLVIREGGWSDPLAIKGSLRLVGYCFLMQDRWKGRDRQTQRHLYRKLSHLDREVFTELWEDFKDHLAEAASVSAASVPDAVASTAAEPKPAPAKLPQPPPGKGTVPGKNKTDPKEPKEPKEKSELQTVISEATKMKVRVTAILGHATGVLSGIYGDKDNNVEADEKWKWAANGDNGGTLRGLLKTVRAAITPYQNRWLTEDVADVKKTSSPETQVSELKNLLELKAKFENVKDQLDTMVTRHNARPKKKQKRD